MLPTILIILAVIVVLGVLAGIIRGRATRKHDNRMPPTRTEAIVEVRSGTLSAFDFPSEAVRYQLPPSAPGWYRVPLCALERAPAGGGPSSTKGVIEVDLGTIVLVDAQFEDTLRLIEDRLFKEVNACPSVIYRYNDVVNELGIRFDYLDVDDGGYVLDVSRIERLNDSDVKDLQQVAPADPDKPCR